jgi:hypothetical protein
MYNDEIHAKAQDRRTIAPPRIHRNATEITEIYGNEIRDVRIFQVSITERFLFV